MYRDKEGMFAARHVVGRTGNRVTRWISVGVVVACGSIIGGLMLVEDWSTEATAQSRSVIEESRQWLAAHDARMAGIAEAAEIDRLDLKIQQIKNDVLDTLANCESPGDTRHTLPVIQDNNTAGTLPRSEIVSIGTFRFKQGTVTGYEKLRSDKVLTPTEAVLLALDESRARQLASFIIFETPEGDKGIDNWHICNVKHGLEERVDLVKLLEA